MYDELGNVGYAKGIIQFLEAGFVILNEAQCSQSHLLEKSITILDFGILEYISSPAESILPQNSFRLNFLLCWSLSGKQYGMCFFCQMSAIKGSRGGRVGNMTTSFLCAK